MNTIDTETLRTWLAQGRLVSVVDVRTSEDRAEWSIPGSVHIDAYAALKSGDTDALAGLVLPDAVPVVTICGAGKISLVAAEQLAARGFTVYSLEGGMRAWSLAWNHAELTVPKTGTRILQVRRTGKGCLSYLIGNGNQAAVIDAALEPAVYLQLAKEQGWTITAVFDTHIHADHLSRSRLLAKEAGAQLYLPAQERVTFPFSSVTDGNTFKIGEAELRAIHTPGHTLESTTYALDEAAVFTGDTLFLSAVGRPDLEASPEEARRRAQLLYASLQRLTALPSELLVFPGHTSAPVPFDGRPVVANLAQVKAAIPRLALPEAAFVAEILARIPPTPPNHRAIIEKNEAGELLEDPTSLEAGANRCAVA